MTSRPTPFPQHHPKLCQGSRGLRQCKGHRGRGGHHQLIVTQVTTGTACITPICQAPSDPVAWCFPALLRALTSFLFIILFFLKHLYWSIIALQWYVSFCFITNWISYTYTYVPISLPSCVSLPPTLPIHSILFWGSLCSQLIHPSLLGPVLVYAYCPNVIINSAPFTVKCPNWINKLEEGGYSLLTDTAISNLSTYYFLAQASRTILFPESLSNPRG